ncbi:MAG: hypothetical protein ACRD4S_16880 [Candidatus Acidiferrales bacterium]
MIREFMRRLRSRSCVARGHLARAEVRGGLLSSTNRQAVAFRVIQERTMCARCGYALTPWRTVTQRALGSLMLPPKQAEKFAMDGELWD